MEKYTRVGIERVVRFLEVRLGLDAFDANELRSSKCRTRIFPSRLASLGIPVSSKDFVGVLKNS